MKKRHGSALIFVILSPRKESRADFDVCGIYRLKIKPFIINALIVCLCLSWSLAGISVPLASAAETDPEAEIAQPTLVLDHDLSLAKQVTVEPKPTADSSKKSAMRIKLRMSRSINNFEALNKKTPEPQVIDAASFKKEAEEEKKMLADGGIILEGDRMEVFQDRHITAFGNGVLRSDSSTILGDRIEFDQENSMMHSTGHASIEEKDSLAKGPALHINMDDGTGEMPKVSFTMFKPPIKSLPPGALGEKIYNQSSAYDADLMASTIAKNSPFINQSEISSESITPLQENRSTSSRGDAQMMYFEGEGKKRFIKSKYTTCAADSDDWYVKSGQLKINDDTKTATATNTTVEFKGVPILYSPWMSFPYAHQRKSGFLSPLWGTTTKSGFELLEPFYWNISPNMDATISARALSKRGIQLQGEFRYLEENYSGLNILEYLPSDSMTGQDRYFAKIKHIQNFGNGWSGGVDAMKVSDSQYFSDLSTHIVTTSQVNLRQQANLNYSGNTWQFGALVQKYQTLDGISYPYQRLPQLTLNGSKDWDWGTTKIQNQLVMFDTDPNSTLAVKSATRFNTYPSISFPMLRSYGYVTPKVGVNYTAYNLNDYTGSEYSKTADRTLPIFSLDSGLFFERDTRIVNRKYTQTLEPRLFYVYIPYQDQSNLPVFDTGLMDLNMGTLFAENQYAGIDRINNANQVSYALTSRMIDADTGEQRLAATVGQRFYFADQKVALPNQALRSGDRSDIVATATMKLRSKWNIDAAWQYNTDTGETVKTNIGTRYNPDPGKLLNLSYRYTKNIVDPTKNLEQINVSGQWPLGGGYYTLGRLNYSITDSKAVETLAGIEYDAGCWQSRLVVQRVETATAQANYAFFYQLELDGLTSVGSTRQLFKLINRNIPGYKGIGMLPDNYRDEYSE